MSTLVIAFAAAMQVVGVHEAWFGPIQLCAGSVHRVSAVTSNYSREPVTIVPLTPGATRQMAKLTAASIGQQIPIQVGGRIESNPFVQAEIMGGRFELNGPMPATFDAVSAAARRPCRAAARR